MAIVFFIQRFKTFFKFFYSFHVFSFLTFSYFFWNVFTYVSKNLDNSNREWRVKNGATVLQLVTSEVLIRSAPNLAHINNTSFLTSYHIFVSPLKIK